MYTTYSADLLFLINNTAYEKVLILLQQFELLNYTD